MISRKVEGTPGPARDARGPLQAEIVSLRVPSTPRQYRMKPECEDAYRKAYERATTDVGAARLVGVSATAFRSWRVSRGFRRRVGPGNPWRRPTPGQQRVLDYLREHPWQATHVLGRELGVHPIAVHAELQALEARELVEVCLVDRAKRFALTGAPLPEGGMPFMRGAPSLYHAARIPLRVREMLQKEPFLPCSVIAARIAPLATVKSVEGQVLRMAQAGELQRHVIRTVRRKMYVYALPGAYLTEGRIRRAQKAVAAMSKFGVGTAKALEVLRRKPWLSSTELQEAMGISRTAVQSILGSLRDSKEVQRVRVEEAMMLGQPVRYRYALPDAKVPEDLAVEDVDSSLVRIARIVKDLPRASSAEIAAEYHRRHPRREARFPAIQEWLRKLVGLGIVTTWTHGALAHRYEANGKADELVAFAAKAHRDAIEHRVSKLRELGFTIDVRMRPPAGWAARGGPPSWRRPV